MVDATVWLSYDQVCDSVDLAPYRFPRSTHVPTPAIFIADSRIPHGSSLGTLGIPSGGLRE